MSFFEDLLNSFSSGANNIDAQSATSAYSPNQQPAEQGGASLGGFLWKPISERNNALAVLLPPGISASQVQLADQDGNILDTGRLSVSPTHPDGRTNGGRLTFRFGKPGGAYGNNVKILVDGQELTTVPNGSSRFEGSGSGLSQGSANPFGFPSITNAYGITSLIPNFTNPYSGIGFDPLTADQLPVPSYNFVDPLQTALETGEFNQQQFANVINQALQQAPEVASQLNQANFDIADLFAGFQEGQISRTNAFNQAELTSRVESQLPGFIRGTKEDLQTARTLAGGDLPDFIDERVLLGGVRNSATDNASFQGFGAGSVFGRNVADRLDARNRLGLVETGINLTDRIADRAFGTYIDSPIKAKPVLPAPVTADNLFGSFADTQLNLSTLNPTTALQSLTGQNQFLTQLEDNTGRFNIGNQLAVDRFNTEQALALALAEAQAGFAIQQGMFNAGQGFFNSTANSAFQQQQLDSLISQQNRVNDQNQNLSLISLGLRGIGGLTDFGFFNGQVDNAIERIIFGSGDSVASTVADSIADTGFLGTGLGNGVTDSLFEEGLDAIGTFISGWF